MNKWLNLVLAGLVAPRATLALAREVRREREQAEAEERERARAQEERRAAVRDPRLRQPTPNRRQRGS